MNWLIIVVKAAILIISAYLEHNKVKKERKKTAVKMLKAGIKNRNPALITAAFQRAKGK